MTIHFICRGNAHRSLMAEAYLKSLHLKDVNVLSSGTIADIHRTENEPIIQNVIKRIEKRGTDSYAKTRSDQLTQDRVNNADITICMNQIVVDECSDLVTLPDDTIIWNITDTGEGHRIIQPGQDPYKYLDEIYEEIARNIDELVHNAQLR